MSFILHRTSDGITGPRFQCDRCGKLIDSSRGALLLWDDNFKEETKDIDPRIVCGQCHYLDAQELPMSMELNTALIYLLNSLGMKERDIRQAREIAGLLSSIR
jgi:hypothetical protein